MNNESRRVGDLKVLYPAGWAVAEKHLCSLGIQLLDTFEFPPAIGTHWTLKQDNEHTITAWLMTTLALTFTNSRLKFTMRDIFEAGRRAGREEK